MLFARVGRVHAGDCILRAFLLVGCTLLLRDITSIF
jgi:hypothetical protein